MVLQLNQRTIVLLIFEDGRPSQVATYREGEHNGYSIVYCSAHNLYTYEDEWSGPAEGGIPLPKHLKKASFWAAADLALADHEEYERISEIPPQFNQDFFDDLARVASHYCSICEDHFPTHLVCEHIYCCPICGPMTPGDFEARGKEYHQGVCPNCGHAHDQQ